MNWYLIHTKPRQEKRALLNLDQQGYECYLPVCRVERARVAGLVVDEEPLFPRYLFIRLDDSNTARGWGAIRFTKGVSRLVTFGSEPAKAPEYLIEEIKHHERALQDRPRRLFAPGERVRLVDGPFAGVEGLYQMTDGESRAMVLIELLSKSVKVSASYTHLRRAG